MERRMFAGMALAGTAGLLGACSRRRAAPFSGYAFVANSGSRSVAAVDLSRFAIARQIAIDGTPAQILAPYADQPTLYALASEGRLCEIDASSLTVRRTLDVKTPLQSVLWDAARRRFWLLGVANEVFSVDSQSLRVVRTVRLPFEAEYFDLAANRALMAVGHSKTGSVSYLNLVDGNLLLTRKVGDAVGQVKFRSDGLAVMVANTASKRLTVLDAPDGRVVTHLPLAVRPDRMCISRDGGQIFITGEGRDAVVIVYPFYVPQVAETVLAGHAPGAMNVTNSLLLVANPQAGGLTILNLERRKLLATIGVGIGPSQILFTPDDQYALVLNRVSGDMAVVRLQTIPNQRRKTAGVFTIIPVGTNPVSAAVVGVPGA